MGWSPGGVSTNTVLERQTSNCTLSFQLEVKEHIREAQKKKAYDPKKSVWVPNPSKDVGGYFEGISEEEIEYNTFAAGKNWLSPSAER